MAAAVKQVLGDPGLILSFAGVPDCTDAGQQWEMVAAVAVGCYAGIIYERK